ncbi:DNA-directed RNA polymerase subunit beta [Cardinium endosymbiont cEper1 of Encarsia pergandiella]|uniref:DNA-directed RNA polymerase subunit beta n=1 Tax=Cardinium endosymbiont of Encarsia pergandiella TaxID=249402 RepID=UPI00027E9F42|nr:DNA-directed RNA polymerase subunit beta [Cardinium endosymbiont of Encarsia pergandiella]CCM10115.1 DNA-directed RNA polymerase subunit beta [Cardinium endosymbiont cEper1 of Encarsia pergandiella]
MPSVDAPANYTDLLEIQLQSFRDFFQLGVSPENRISEGLYKVFMEHFPIEDSKRNYILEFIDYNLELPQYTPRECIERGLTYDVPLKAKLRLLQNDEHTGKYEGVEQEVFLGNIPYMTDQGSFILSGVERVVVSQVHKSSGIFFFQNKHISGSNVYAAKVVPAKGVWIEFSVDINSVMYIYLDRKKKIPITTMLRAIGYSSDKDILGIFGLADEVEASGPGLEKYIGRKLAARVLKSTVEHFIDEETGEKYVSPRHEVLVERNTVLDEAVIEVILSSGVPSVILHHSEAAPADYHLIYNTFGKDSTNDTKEAIEQIYRQLRNAEAPDEQTARETVESLFFSSKRYTLGEVGRYRINKKLNLDIPLETSVLTQEDIIQIIHYLIKVVNGKAEVDDIDHLSNRRVRSVGEQLFTQFGIGLSRLARTIRERINIRDNELFKPADLINARTLSSVISSFFGINPLSQLIDQVNPLAEITHKRRVSALGPGGLSRDRAGFEVRDVHYSHYGRLCTIETPEGMNIGLISSLCMYARVNNMGFIETPYRRVEDGKVDLSGAICYLSAAEEEHANFAPANVQLDANGVILDNRVKVRNGDEYPLVKPEQVNYMDVSSSQIASVAASLIPFLEHNDASRALMGSNMQRQAVPLVRPDVPIVCTGVEKRVAKEFRGLPTAEGSGLVTYVDGRKIVVQYDRSEEEALVAFDEASVTYSMDKFRGTNRSTCINLSPIVAKGSRVEKGQVLCEGYATKNAELALGKNLKVAFLSWKGYTFEDGIVISERIVRDGVFTSIHIKEFILEVKDTKFGAEELTNEIPNVSEEAISKLGIDGIVKVGTEVKEGDILIGKITPKGEIDATPEARLLKAIFGDKAGDVKNTSLKVPSGMEGIVIDTKIFSSPERNKESKQKVKKELELLKKAHAKKLLKLRDIAIQKLSLVLDGVVTNGIYHQFGDEIIAEGTKLTAPLIAEKLFPPKNIYRDESLYNIPAEANLVGDLVFSNWTPDPSKNHLVQHILGNYIKKCTASIVRFKRERFTLEAGDGLPKGVVKVAKVYIAEKRKLKVGDKMSGRHGNKGIVCKIVPQEDMPFLADGTPVDVVLSPLGLPSRMNLGQLYETVLGWAGEQLGKRYVNPIFEGMTLDQISSELQQAGLPAFGKTTVYDGGTGMPFNQSVTVGVVYLLKLAHLVDDKMHARSTGPYSLITQQPLGGKAQFGGQRFGEMEVWALEAYGAAYTLQEMLNTKSDDVVGRSKAYEAIVKGNNIPRPNLSESFNVLMHELRGLGLEITLV